MLPRRDALLHGIAQLSHLLYSLTYLFYTELAGCCQHLLGTRRAATFLFIGNLLQFGFVFGQFGTSLLGTGHHRFPVALCFSEHRRRHGLQTFHTLIHDSRLIGLCYLTLRLGNLIQFASNNL